MKSGRRGAWVAVALLATACASQQTSKTTTAPTAELSRPEASPDVLRGERLLTEGKVGEATRIFERAVADNPDDARAWLDLGLARQESGKLESAEDAYRRAAEADPGFAQAFNNLGLVLRERGRLDEAVPALEHAVALDPELAVARFNLALAYEEQGKAEAAEAQYRETISRLPRDPVPRINLAMMLLVADRRDEAAAELEAARPLVRDDVLLSIAVGEGLRRAGRPADAVAVLKDARDRAPDPAPTELLAELALAHYALGELDDAEATMREAIEQDELDPALHYAYGSILAKQGQLGKARSHLRRTIKLDPDGYYAERARARLERLKR